MLSVHLICVGKLKEKFYLEACKEYEKRLGGYCKLTLTELPRRSASEPTQGQTTRLCNGGRCHRAKLPPSASLVALCVEGKLRSSEELAKIMADWQQSSAKHLVFLIGGSYGLHPSIKQQAWLKLSMSPMTFPHHLARVMLLEQVYRAFKINEGSSYHK